MLGGAGGVASVLLCCRGRTPRDIHGAELFHRSGEVGSLNIGPTLRPQALERMSYGLGISPGHWGAPGARAARPISLVGVAPLFMTPRSNGQKGVTYGGEAWRDEQGSVQAH